MTRGKQALIGTAVFALTVASLYVAENWRGKRAWNEYKRQFESKGKTLDWSKYIPPAVPDEQNIFKAPGMSRFIKGEPATSILNRMDELNQILHRGNSNGVLVATLVIAPVTNSDTGHHASSLADAVEEIQMRASRRLWGASGPAFIDDFRTAKPIQIARGTENRLTVDEVKTRLPDFSVRPASSNQFEVILEKTTSASDYLEWSKSVQDEVEMIATALKRPYARMEGDYQVPFSVPVANYVAIRSLAQMLGQQAQCYLLAGKPDEALARLTLIHEIRAMLETGPTGKSRTLVEAMISVAIKGLYVAVIQDGLRLGAWQDVELAALGEQLRTIDLLPLVNEAFNAELVGMIHLAQTVPLSKIFSLGNEKRFQFFDLLPRGWTYQNMVAYARIMGRQIDAVESALPLVAPRKIEEATASVESGLSRFSPYIYLARVGIPNTGKAFQVTTRNQTRIHQAQIVCALERYRLARGEYPARLEELVPEFLQAVPRDLVGGESMPYQRTAEKGFLLYSIGWNDKDDGGQASADWKQGDWIWTSRHNHNH